MDTYHYVCLRYRFRPNIPDGLQKFIDYQDHAEDQNIDVSFIDQKVREHFITEIEYSDIRIQQSTVDKLKEAGILTVGDFIMNAATNRMYKRFKMSPTTLQKVADYIDENFGINRQDYKKHYILRECLNIRYSVIKSAQSETK